MMRDDELEESQDDLDVEITNLDEGKAAGLAPGDARLFARRHKRPLTMAMVGMVALAILLIVVNTSAVRGLAIKVLALPTLAPVRALYPGEGLFYVRADPVWERLTVLHFQLHKGCRS